MGFATTDLWVDGHAERRTRGQPELTSGCFFLDQMSRLLEKGAASSSGLSYGSPMVIGVTLAPGNAAIAQAGPSANTDGLGMVGSRGQVLVGTVRIEIAEATPAGSPCVAAQVGRNLRFVTLSIGGGGNAEVALPSRALWLPTMPPATVART